MMPERKLKIFAPPSIGDSWGTKIKIVWWLVVI